MIMPFYEAVVQFVIVKIGDSLLINVYFPCQGTADRLTVCDDMLCEIAGWRERFSECQCIIAGDFNNVTWIATMSWLSI